MAVWRNTTYTAKAPEEPNEKFGAGATGAVRIFDLFDGSFTGRLQAAYDFLGYAGVVATKLGGPYYIGRLVPMAYPAKPAVLLKTAGILTPPDVTNRIFAMAISRTEPLGAPLGIDAGANPVGTAAANYARARMTLDFSTVPYQIRPDSAVLAAGGPLNGFPDEGTALAIGWVNTRYVIRHSDPQSRLLKVPYGVAYVAGKNIPEAIPKREGGQLRQYTWIGVPMIGIVSGFNEANAGSLIGTINNALFDGCPAGTLLLDTYKTREYQGSFGEPLVDVTYNMVYAPHPSTGQNLGQPFPGGPGGVGPAKGFQLGWNFFFASVNQKPDYYLATMDAAGNIPIYSSGDFTSLFRP